MDDLKLPKAKRTGRLRLGNWEFECHHLETQQRVVTQRSFAEVLDIKRGGRTLGYKFARLLDDPRLKSPVFNELSLVISNPIRFQMTTGPTAFGYEGTTLVDYCNAVLRARKIGALRSKAELRYAAACEVFITGCAKTGITALIDEATGYSEEKKRHEYRELFKDFIRQEIREWEKEFPDSFFDNIYRLYGLQRRGRSHPQFFGHFIRTFVYAPLAESNGAILEALDERNPIVRDLGGRRHKMHQFLTDEVGLPKLRLHLRDVSTIAEISDDPSQFRRMFKKKFPKSGDQTDLSLGD